MFKLTQEEAKIILKWYSPDDVEFYRNAKEEALAKALKEFSDSYTDRTIKTEE
jgi:hypothetical protein